MPDYDYECSIHGEFEETHSINIKLEFCPKCKEEGKKHPVKRLISLTAKGQIELYGEDLVAKVKADAKKDVREAHQSEKKYANIIGEDRYQSIQTQMDRQKR
jgi:hypothetical protein